ncbi:hypothetical protein KEF29_05255 [Streptomyces tuirus]|uniref:Uncharacterized protein n=1 Tax=Streptomyces tuirus TaxID=68278 RepID=A0A941IZA5_9ACTN|nr:hypothetical protein [Streptomyces tuirus]
MSLSAELRAFYDRRQEQIPADVREIMNRAGRELAASGQVDRALTVGAHAPGFSLPSATARPVTTTAPTSTRPARTIRR